MPKPISRLGPLLSVVLLLLAPALFGATKPKTTKQPKDFSKYVDIQGASKVGADRAPHVTAKWPRHIVAASTPFAMSTASSVTEPEVCT